MVRKDLKDHEEEIDSLVIEAQKGKTEAFAKLYDFYVTPVYRYIYFKVPKEEALDLTESLFLKIWENLKSYQKRAGSFSSWVFRIAHNLIVDHYRLQKEPLPLDFGIQDEKRESNPVYLAERSLSHATLKVAISKLKKKYQQILLLKYISELENEEISQILKKSAGSLRILKFRALKALKRVLEEMNVTP